MPPPRLPTAEDTKEKIDQAAHENDFDQPTADFVDTGANNSLTPTSGLFAEATPVGGDLALCTSSTLTNIHSHVIIADSANWTDYTLTGLFRRDSPSGGIGVTVGSDFTLSAAYGRLREYFGSSELHLTSLGSSSLSCDVPTTGMTTDAGVWYRERLK